MDYGKILARAFEITYKYRAMWLFGFFLALFGGNNGSNFNSLNYSVSGRERNSGFPDGFPNLPPNFGQYVAAIVGAVVCLVLILIVIGTVARIVSRGALIGLAQELEANGTTPTVRRGFSIGASRFWQLLGISIVINLPLTIFSVAVILIALLPFLLTILPTISQSSGNGLEGLLAGGIITSIAFICCAALCVFVVALIVRPFFEFIVRVCVVEKLGIVDSIRAGYRVVSANLGNVAILYVLVIGVGIGFGLLMIPVSLLLIGLPVGIGVVAYIASQSLVPAILAAAVVGIPLALVLIFISGLYHAFESNVWTEGYLAITKRAVTPMPIVTSTTTS